MKSVMAALSAAALAVVFATPAWADSSLEGRVAQIEQQLATQTQPSAREIQSSVDAYLASSKSDVALVGGPGAAGYDGGFWIRGGTFLLKINLTIQTRYEAFRWDDESAEPRPGGDLSGFSLPRVTLKFSGDATCDVHYYAELEFGHSGSIFGIDQGENILAAIWETHGQVSQAGPSLRGPDMGIAREAWIEYEAAPAIVFRMGLIQTAA